jgi:hypothetical protein
LDRGSRAQSRTLTEGEKALTWHAGCAYSGVQTSSLFHGPLSAVRGALDAVKYAQAFVTHAPRRHAGLTADDDERDLILEEELGASAAQVVPEQPVSPA